jgi:hypothetical protein
MESLPSSFDRFERKPLVEKPAVGRKPEWRKVAVGKALFLCVNGSCTDSCLDEEFRMDHFLSFGLEENGCF